MDTHPLHITNGSSLTTILKDLDFTGDILAWEEMLCEGPTISNINSEAFLELRTAFFNAYYNVDLNIKEIKEALYVLDHTESYTEIILWFEYDLFCHINMIAVIALLRQKKINLPLFLVCSGRVEGESNLKGLSELTENQLRDYYNNKIRLTANDINLAITVWDIYCGKDHNLLKPYIVKRSNFEYLGSCLKAHLKRFPDSKSGLNVLETNILEIINRNDIKSENHLLGYALNYQGYYGYGDVQFTRIIKYLRIFFSITKNGISLNRKGHEALLGHHNFSKEVNNAMEFGGVNKLDFQFNKKQNKLVKTVLNVH